MLNNMVATWEQIYHREVADGLKGQEGGSWIQGQTYTLGEPGIEPPSFLQIYDPL